MKRNKVIKTICIGILSAIFVLAAIPAFMYCCLGEDTFIVEMENEITNNNYKDKTYKQYMINGATVRPDITRVGATKYNLEIEAFSDEPRKIEVLYVAIWDKKTNEILFEKKKQVQLNAEKMEGKNNCFDIKPFEEITIDEKYIKNNRTLVVQLTVSSTDEVEDDLKTMKYLFTVKEIRVLDTP